MHNKKLITFISSIILTCSLSANDSEGKELFIDASCLDCHETTSFKHREEKVNNFPSLKAKIKMCEFNSGTGWFDDEIDSVSEYLNKTYYHYKR